MGQAVAAQWIALRANDGLEAPIQFVWGHGPGIWEPVPPFPPPATPWMASFKPFTYENASDFLSSITPPLPLASREWADDYNLTKAYGALNGSARTPKETEIGLFWTDFPAAIFSRAMRSLISENKLDTAESARLAAMQYVSLADSLIACFNGKYHYAFWRPYTAIHDSDTSINPERFRIRTGCRLPSPLASRVSCRSRLRNRICCCCHSHFLPQRQGSLRGHE